MNKSVLLVLLFFLFYSYGCVREPANRHEALSQEERIAIQDLSPLSPETAEAMLQTNCYTCHQPNSKSHDEMLAPPLAGIKFMYQQHYPERTTFIARMTDFIAHPRKENAIMRGPVRRFGLMPATTFDKQQLRQISAYIFDHPLKTPDWFSDHFEDHHGPEAKRFLDGNSENNN